MKVAKFVHNYFLSIIIQNQYKEVGYIKNIGIYQIINLINGKVYIGSSSVNIIQRWRCHKSYLKTNKHQNNYLQNAYNKYGKENFVMELVELVSDKNKVISVEQKWLDKLQPFTNTNNGYNICKTAGNTCDKHHSKDSKLKMSKAKIGNKVWLGKKHTEETKLKMSKSQKGKKLSEETKQKMSEARSKINITEETKRKISKSLIGNKRHLGIKHTEETRQKISKTLKKYNKCKKENR